jgi:indole-3-glycerol phosphate synthase
MNILDEIMKHKRMEVDRNSIAQPIKSLEKSIYFNRATYSLKKNVLDKTKHGIIAEIKRKSPSKGIINPNVSIEDISKGYVAAGVSAISVLTDVDYFGGSNNDLTTVRELNSIPILRKDFILDEYQIVEAKSIGADAILLIAAALPAKDLKRLSLFAASLGLEILLEVHNEKELTDTQDVPADLVGVNNRNLQTFEVSIDVSKQLISKIRKGVAAVSESGIENPSAIKELRALGYSGFLIGQSFMQTTSPENACRDFINELKS